MKVFKLKKGIPKTGIAKRYAGIVKSWNFKPIRHARSSVKVIIFDTLKNMQSFYSKFCKQYKKYCKDTVLNKETRGVNIQLGYDLYDVKMQTIERHYVDPNFISVICFAKNHIYLEYINHEAIHAAHTYARRTKNDTKKWPGEKELPEERVCYYAGRLSSSMIRVFLKSGIKILDLQQSK